jgi:16S rRNA A1518/A1519 N6-dimethyltransferase RsmA/KsgA/DIM1 with predicted DNA glycosylase/AP lyase activity
MPHQALQQHDLDSGQAKRFVADAKLRADDAVLEIGPGTGRITAHLLEQAARVQAVERDPARAAGLRTRFAAAIEAGRLVVLCGDALVLEPAWVGDWRVVANPPFQITSELVRHWLLDDLPCGWPTRIDLVMQREAAQRLCGTTNYGLSRNGVLCRLFGQPRLQRQLPRDAVSPPSRVDLATWSLKRREHDLGPDDLRLVDRLLEPAFAGAHSLREALKGLATKPILQRNAAEFGYDPAVPPRQVPAEAWLALARFLRSIGKL